MKIITLTKDQIKINKRRLEKRIMQAKAEVPSWLALQIEECLQDSEIEPRGVFSFFYSETDTKNNTIKIGDIAFQSSFMAKRFKYADEVGLFIATIGSYTAKKAQESYEDKDGLKALIYDAIGSEYAESTANTIHKLIEENKGYCMSRYSPGYNDWHISEQTKLFQFYGI